MEHSILSEGRLETSSLSKDHSRPKGMSRGSEITTKIPDVQSAKQLVLLGEGINSGLHV